MTMRQKIENLERHAYLDTGQETDNELWDALKILADGLDDLADSQTESREIFE